MEGRVTTITDPTMCVYEVGPDLRIIRVDDGWTQFAEANRAPELTPPGGPIGQSVLTCVADATSAALYERLFDHVMRTQSAVTFPIRCDAPVRRRFLQVRIEPRRGGGLRVETTLVKTEDRPAVALLDPDVPRDGAPLRMCGWCKSVDIGDRWCEVEEAVAELRLFECESLPPTTHGMCPDCYERVSQEFDGEPGAASQEP